jgi:hypothetical protein
MRIAEVGFRDKSSITAGSLIETYSRKSQRQAMFENLFFLDFVLEHKDLVLTLFLHPKGL